MQQGRPVGSFVRRATSSLLLAFLAVCCRLCGAFIPAPATTATTTTTTVFHQRAHSSSTSARSQHGRRSRALSVRMQQTGSSDEELQVAVSKLAAQVEDLTAMVAQLAGEPAGGAGGAKGINGAVVDAGAAVPVVSTTSKGKSESKPPLVSTSAAQQRIDQWLQESGAGLAAAPAAPAPAAPAAPAAPVAPAAVPEVAAPPAEEAPAAGSGYKVKIEWDGAIHEVTCDEETTLLEAAMDAGLELPSSCMSGSCLTCPGKLVSGSVDQSEGVLEDEQTEAGFLLTCISYPQSDVHFAVVDEEDLP